MAAYINSRATSMASDVNCMLVYFPCLPNVTYTINKVLSARFRAGYTTVTPENGVSIFGGVADNTATSISIATSSNAQYLVVYYYDSANDTLSETEIYNSLTISYRGEMSAVDKVARADKVDKQQDVSDAGKAMIVGNDGVLAPTEIADGLSETAKIALLNCFKNVVWKTGSANDYYTALETALYADAYPKIVAVYNPGTHVVYTDDALDTLKPYLTVYYYASASSEAVVVPSTDYALSGSLTEGASTVLVSYSNATTTFIVNVTDYYHVTKWGLALGNLFQQGGSVNTNASASPTNADMNVDQNSLNVRRTFITHKGKAPFYTHTVLEETTFFPIPVPPTANHVSIKGVPSGHFFYANFAQYDESTGKYLGNISGNRISWTQQTGETLEHNFTAYDNMFMFINAKNDSSGTAFTSDFTDMTIEFSEV